MTRARTNTISRYMKTLIEKAEEGRNKLLKNRVIGNSKAEKNVSLPAKFLTNSAYCSSISICLLAAGHLKKKKRIAEPVTAPAIERNVRKSKTLCHENM